MTVDTTANVYRTTSPRLRAAVKLTACLRSAVAVLLVVAAAMVASRRLAGALETPLGPFLLLVTGGLLAGLARIAHAPMPTGRFRSGSVLISLAMLIIAASLSLPGSNLVALLGFWTMIVGEELWAWRREREPGSRRGTRGGVLAQRVGSRVAGREAREDFTEPADGDPSYDPEPTELATDVLQQLTLRSTAEGGQELSGWLRMPLVAGQRTGSLHVAFCPAFGQVPQVEVEPVCGPDCRIKAAQVLPYGARLDVKLDEPAREDESVLVWLSCTSAFPG